MCTLKISIQDLIIYVRRYVEENATGLLGMLNLYAKTMYGMDAITMFFNDFSKFLEILDEVYGSRDSSLLVLKLFFIRPVLIKLNRLDKLDEILSIIREKPTEFKKLLQDLGVYFE